MVASALKGGHAAIAVIFNQMTDNSRGPKSKEEKKVSVHSGGFQFHPSPPGRQEEDTASWASGQSRSGLE